jgi:hypothetical protein
MKICRAIFLLLLMASGLRAGTLPPIQTVFVIVLENHCWVDFKNSPSAPYLNGTLLPLASFCEAYYNPPGLHPSEPNYLWLEAGTNFGILNNNNPVINHLNTTNHLVAQLRGAGISWKTYQEDIPGTVVPLDYVNNYAPRHNPFVFFDDLTGTNNPNDAYGIAHNRPLTELFADLTNNAVARYNFVTPNVCSDGHDSCPPDYDPVKQSDNLLALLVPKIFSSAAYANNGAVFIVWDEGESGNDGPIGMIVLSRLARGGGYFNRVHYTHSSFVRTVQEIFNVSPWLADAANATDLSDLFAKFSISSVVRNTNGAIRLDISGVVPNRTNLVEASTNFVMWQTISTNQSSSNSFSITDNAATNRQWQFYRVREAQ